MDAARDETIPRLHTDQRPPGDTRSLDDTRSPGNTLSPGDTCSLDDTRSPGNTPSPGDTCSLDSSRPPHVTRSLDAEGHTIDLSADAPGEVGAQGLPERIGLYRIVGELGRGGMGIVYVGEDPRLERRIALKILPRTMAGDADALARFRREARTLASMNHPGIAIIHSLEEADQVTFLTMELIDGETLAAKVERGPLGVDDVIAVGRQIARALEAAHGKGIVHRDLKPQNIMVTADATVKVLDFGLATKVRESSIDGALATTGSNAGASTIAGTPGFMSPEQIRGEAIGPGTDVWAYGCILYECLAGAPAFPGDTITERLRATLLTEPDLSRLPPDTPPRLRDVVARCLVKDAARRLDTSALARRELEEELARRALAATLTPLREAPSNPTNFPASLSSFVGRERPLENALGLLADSRLVTLTGMGGTGKTRLSLEVGRRLLPVMAGGAWFVELAPITDPGSVTQAIATALGVRDAPDRGLIETLLEHVRDKSLLLILDNCEHLKDACRDIVDRILGGSTSVRILATSREPLGSAAEAVYGVPPLQVPAARNVTPESIVATESGRLFVERAAKIRADFRLTGENAGAVAEICRRLDGIPLAIELAAARIQVLPPQEIAKRLDQRFRLLTGGQRGALPHHRTLRALIDWSWDQLDAREQVLLRRLSAFAGGWGLQAAEEICASEEIEGWEVLDLLTSLIDKSLVLADPDGGEASGVARYEMLETVREYAREKLLDAGETVAVYMRHGDHFLAVAEEAEIALTGFEQRAWLARLAVNHENLKSALQWFAGTPETTERALLLAGALGRYWFVRGHWSEGRELYRRVLATADTASRTEARAKALSWAGNLAKLQGDLGEARSCLEESLSIRRELGDRAAVAASLTNLGNVCKDEGDLERAAQLYDESLSIRRDLGNRPGVAVSLHCLGLVAHLQGRFDDASRHDQEALAIRRELGDQWGIAASLHNLGATAEAQGDLALATDRLEESLDLRRELGDRAGIAAGLINLGRLAASSGDAERARASYEAALDVCRELGDRRNAAAALNSLGELAKSRGDTDSANQLLRESLATYRDLNDWPSVAMLLEALGTAATSLAPDRAARLLGSAAAMRERTRAVSPSAAGANLEESVQDLRRQLGDAAFTAQWTTGRDLSPEDAVSRALDELKEDGGRRRRDRPEDHLRLASA